VTRTQEELGELRAIDGRALDVLRGSKKQTQRHRNLGAAFGRNRMTKGVVFR
jgi:hypothetical protein